LIVLRDDGAIKDTLIGVSVLKSHT
jgi:hypothetical protein